MPWTPGWILLALLAIGGRAAAHPSDEPIVLLSLSVHDQGLRYELDVPRSLIETLSGAKLPMADGAKVLESLFTELYRGRNPVFVDGHEVAPRYKEGGILEASREEESTPQEDPLVYVVLEYPSTSPPGRIDVTWTWTEVFDRAGLRVPKAKGDLTGAGGFEPIEFDAEKKLHSWKRRLAPAPATVPQANEDSSGIPVYLVALLAVGLPGVIWLGPRRRRWMLAGVVGTGLAGVTLEVRARAALPDAAAAAGIARGLIEDVYRCFDGRSEGEVYDLLARRMDGELLDRTYREIHQGLFLDHSEKKSTVRILSVDVIAEPMGGEGGLLAEPAFHARARWKVRGLVVHTGHVHARTREFAAIYRIARRDGAWKLTGCEVLDLERAASRSLTEVTVPSPSGAPR